ncbi:hypothetical protein DIS24_g1878 [Lasiodiplodia hormozganensis]|uniref:Uncharacterized protein n=1 Tax=Lasiodiplodia hormozganensis TaxID=869390 RepID=A0AA39Z193_9PEZI|nr:hypothetical protein DIS24_g1878 [Lasiodiplodia hormozganensis]
MRALAIFTAAAIFLLNTVTAQDLPGEDVYQKCLDGEVTGWENDCCGLMWVLCVYPTNSDLPRCREYVEGFGCTPPL